HEDQRGAPGDDRRRALVPVPELGRDDQLAAASLLHAHDALVPALDDLTVSEREAEGLVAVAAGIELAALQEPAGVLHRELGALDRDRARSQREVDVLKTVGQPDRRLARPRVEVAALARAGRGVDLGGD